jgi:hypothetical protein
VRADHLDTVLWDHITGLLADPQLIRTEIDRRLDSARTANPVAQQRKRLDTALAKTSNAIASMIEAFGEQLITIDELRARMPDLRARETNLRNQIEALDNQLADREAYLKLASDLEGFLTQFHAKAELSTVEERQRVLRLLVKDVLVGPDKITIRHRIPIRERPTDNANPPPTPTRRTTMPDIAHCVGGVTTPPCGTPLSVAFHVQSSRYPASSSMLRISRRNRSSWIFSDRILTTTRWSKEPKQSEMSASMNHVVPVQVSATSRRAVWQPRPGRNPCDRPENIGS